MTTGDTRGFFRRVLEDRSLDLSQGCRNALADFTSVADNTFAGIVQTVTSKLSLWLNPRVDAATEECDFDLRELRTKRMSIYLGVSPDELDRVAPLYNLLRSEEHTSELQSLMRISYAVFCLKKK